MDGDKIIGLIFSGGFTLLFFYSSNQLWNTGFHNLGAISFVSGMVVGVCVIDVLFQ